jgi:hypothetical protein
MLKFSASGGFVSNSVKFAPDEFQTGRAGSGTLYKRPEYGVSEMC